MKFIAKHSFLLLFFLSVLWISVRLVGFNAPLVNHQFWRQTDTASIAKNFYQEDMNIFYPRVNWRGSTKGFVESEFQLYSFLVALLYNITGEVDDRIGKCMSIFFSLLYGLVFFCFIKKLFDLKTAFLSFVFLLFLPVSVYYSSTFMPESMMLFFYVTAISSFYFWSASKKILFYIISTISFSLALLIKPTAIFLMLPIIVIARKNDGKNFLRSNYLLLFLLLVSIPSVYWYGHAYNLFIDTNLSFGILSQNTYSKFFTWKLISSVSFWYKIISNIFSVLLTPFGASLFFISVLISLHDSFILKKHNFFHVWLLSLLLFIIVVAEGNFTLEYYLMFLIFPASLYMARCLIYISRHLNEQSKYFFLNIIIMTVSLIAFFSQQYVVKRLKPVVYTQRSYDFATKIRQLSNRKDLFIVIDTPTFYPAKWYDKMKYRIRRPSLLYYLNRNGWVFLPHEFMKLELSQMNKMIYQGAHYFLLPKEIQNSFASINDFICKNNLQKIAEDDYFCIYNLWE